MKNLTEQKINELLELRKEVEQGLRPKLPCGGRAGDILHNGFGENCKTLRSDIQDYV